MEEKLSFRCANCGETVEFQTLSNWRDAIKRDLDGRPRETDEFSLENAVQRCPKCDYVSFDVSKNIIKDKSILDSADYKEILNNKSLPESVNNFLALGFVFEKQEEFYPSSNAYLCASWILEKIGKTNEKNAVLEKTAYCLLKYINSESFKAKVNASALTCAVDVLRRIGKFKNAKMLARFALARVSDAEERKILIYQIILCKRNETEPKEIPKYQNYTNLKDVFEAIQNYDDDDEVNKQFIYYVAAELIKNSKLDEIVDGICVTVDKSKHEQLPNAILKTFAEVLNKNTTENVKDPLHKPSRIINESNFGEHYGVKNESIEDEAVKSTKIEDEKTVDEQNDTVENFDKVLDSEFTEVNNSDETEETTINEEESAVLEDEVEETTIEAETDETEETTINEEEPAVLEDEVEETTIEAETDETKETTINEEEPAVLEDEVEETTDVEEETLERAESIILTLAKFDGKISIGEVQALFECSYTKAKEILDEIVKVGKLSWTIDEEVYSYVEI